MYTNDHNCFARKLSCRQQYLSPFLLARHGQTTLTGTKLGTVESAKIPQTLICDTNTISHLTKSGNGSFRWQC